MFNVNEHLNKDDLRESYKEHKSVSITPFLQEESANKLYDFYYYDMPESWWSTSTFAGGNSEGYSDGKSKPQHLRRLPGNTELIEDLCRGAQESFGRGEFSYIFDRTLDDHHEGCPCLECSFREFLKTPELISFVNDITESDVENTREVFASRYRHGHFLSPHHDMNKGKIGFVYSLTRDWKPQWGGNLFILEDDYRTIKKTILSTFNRLVMFDIPSQNGIPHFVSHITPNSPSFRTSVAGWFS